MFNTFTETRVPPFKIRETNSLDFKLHVRVKFAAKIAQFWTTKFWRNFANVEQSEAKNVAQRRRKLMTACQNVSCQKLTKFGTIFRSMPTPTRGQKFNLYKGYYRLVHGEL